MNKRQRDDGLRKICRCSLRAWPRCEHPWHFSFKAPGRARIRVSLDRYALRAIRSLEEAKAIAAELRVAVRAGTFPPPAASVEVTPAAAPPPVVTLAIAATRFLEHVPVLKGKNQGKARGVEDRQKVAALCAWVPPGEATRLGEIAARQVTEDLYEGFIQSLRQKGRAAGTVSKYLQLVKALDRWMARKGYRPAPAVSGESVILRRTKAAKRSRRLAPALKDAKGEVTLASEEDRLLAAANPWLQRLIVAALETGARLGELLGLRWTDVDLTTGWISIRGESNKTGDGRRVPMSSRLRSYLELARLDPAGKQRPGQHHVYGNAVGEPVKSAKKAWETTVLKAHGHTPVWSDTKGLAAESRALLQAIDLHFHDLRHEAGSRWLEGGVALHQVQRMLGHADVKQTATYLNADDAGLLEAIRRFDSRGKAEESAASQSPPFDDHQAETVSVTVN